MFRSVEEAFVTIAVLAVMLLVAFPIHEFSHALVAYRLGDGTAKLLGRLTLDPRAHFDPAGGTLLIITMLLPGSFAFGWAKPTPVSPFNLRGGRQGDALVALAGPLSNFVLAAAAAIPLRTILATQVDVPVAVLDVLALFIQINVALAVFNLIPLPPFDGGHVVEGLLPRNLAIHYAKLRRYGFLLLFLLLLVIPQLFPRANIVDRLVGPPTEWLTRALLPNALL